jgi:Undecaprenyl-phosphate galactose phosphotransferase WbaP
MLQPASVPASELNEAAAHGRLLHRVARTSLLATSDSAMIGLAFATAYFSWAAPVHGQPAAMYVELWPLLLLFVAGYACVGLYPGLGLGPVEMLRRFSYVTAFGFLVLASFSFALKLPPLYSRVTVLLTFLLSLVLVPLGRRVFFRAAHRWHWWAEPVVVIGTARFAARAIRSLSRDARLGYRPVAVILDDGDEAGPLLEGVRVTRSLEKIGTLSRAAIRVALLEATPRGTQTLLDRLQRDFLHVILLGEADNLPIERLQVRSLGGLMGIEYTNNLLRPRNQTAKRVLDLVFGSFALALLAPIIAIAVFAVLAIDGRPLFFQQSRVGLGGRRIRVPKVRTMRCDADGRLEEYLEANPAMRDEWRTRYKLRDDPRLIPGIGRLFRRFSIDELPQLWSVLAGDMSLVGPRPFPDYHLDQFSTEFRELRQRVRPGITGYWQVEVRSAGSTHDQEALDTYYIRNWSIWLDLYVLGRTLIAVASGRGAY